MIFQVEIDLDEIPDLMEEARQLGYAHGSRTRAYNFGMNSSRLIPRTRQSERVRANIRATRSNRAAAAESVAVPSTSSASRRVANQNLPSTSSGFESVSENSYSPIPSSSGMQTNRTRKPSKKSISKRTKITKSKRKLKKPTSSSKKVVIQEIDEDGEIVEYVQVISTSATRKRKSKGRRKVYEH